MTDFSDLDAFAAVASAGGFRSAAHLRGVSASSLSDAVRRLETRLDARLINRSTRSIALTEAGRRLLERLTPALGEIGAALDSVKGSDVGVGGTLRLNVPVVVARIVLPDIIGRFMRENPGINVDITADDTFIDVLAAGYDAGVRYDERLGRDMIAVPLGPRAQRYVTAASPDYLARNGRPKHPRDLLGHSLLRFCFPGGRLIDWEFEKRDETIRIVPEGPLVTDSLEIQIGAAIAGIGLISTFHGFLESALSDGRLETVLDDWHQPFSGPFLYYHSRRHMPGPLRAFVDFLKRQPKA